MVLMSVLRAAVVDSTLILFWSAPCAASSSATVFFCLANAEFSLCLPKPSAIST
jgi:hypothetical protein